uniref:Hemerythrin-like domain-containing protein n=1 Tax=Haptolina ericina TaxID=156174 RepID=A0A7S3B3X7_9EUKA|mmetsp:Transcript_4633/g.10003  ORF Transcript_4633/g.10003 Transcript_4633/m.10003 type:complete len:274 (+) Transcript_4633:231-1052(+)
MDAWAARYGSSIAFICVSCAGPQLATQFGTQLKLKHCHNTWVDQDDMPTWGQLGCNGFIVLDGSHSVISRATPAYLEVREAAFRHVDGLIAALIAEKPLPELPPGAVDPAVGGPCAEVRFGKEAEDAVPAISDAPSAAQAKKSSVNVPSVKVAVLDEEHARCEAALMQLAERRDSAALNELLTAYEEHFAHEEALLDEHLYAGVKRAKGFSADKGARTSHFTDHERMLTEIRNLLSEIKRKADLARDLGLNESVVELSDAISADEVQRLSGEV